MAMHIKIGAMAGEGAFAMGRTLGKLFLRGGYHVHGYPEYPSLIRTGHNAYSVIIDESPVRAPRIYIDVLIALGKDAIFFHKDALKGNALIIYDKALVNIEEFDIKNAKSIAFPALQILKEANAPIIMKNIAFVSATLASISYPLEFLLSAIEEEFKRKGKEVIEMNQNVASMAYEYMNKMNTKADKQIMPIEKKNENIYLSGNEAIILGALAAGLGFYSGYPMTPSSSALAFITEKAEKHDVIVVQAEDEIAVAQMAAGAAFAGLRAMCGTSGGGFALMTETVSMLGMAEIPVVFLVSQRTGPSTGMPTWTEQGDLIQVLGAGQGEFPRAIIAPGTVEQAYYDTAEAFNIAEKYQTAVFILSDKFLSESHFTMKKPDKVNIDRGKIIMQDIDNIAPTQRFLRYKITEDGISPRPIPGVKGGQHVTTSYEHDEDSFTTEDFKKRAMQVDKRAKKLEGLRNESWLPDIYIDGKIANKEFMKEMQIKNGNNYLLSCWGSHLNILLDAQRMLKYEHNISIPIAHFRWLYPLHEQKIRAMLDGSYIIMVENNKTGIFSHLLRMETGVKVNTLVSKYNGRQFFPEQIVSVVLDIMKNGPKPYYALNEEIEKYEFFTPWRYGI
ncbi:MAG: 2-oxoacid:acceptor oxidoreductase subunit alpha [Candidatus Anstonellales archaeon]